MAQRKRVAILGATGSIGHQALDVVRRHPDLFEVDLLSAYSQWQELVQMALEFRPRSVVIGDVAYYKLVHQALAEAGISVFVGEDSIGTLVQEPTVDVVLVAIVGYAGLLPTIRALEAGKTVALANKESLVVAGSLVMELSARYNAPLIPVDSEHSAIFQCLVGELTTPSKLLLTASGGPFRDMPHEELAKVTPMQALQHPAWNMGAKISVDSASMMNKGLEIIEAHWLFSVPYEAIEVLIHPQAVVHSMVQFPDGSIKAQMGTPDMRMPIQYALTYPYRIDSGFKVYNFGPGEGLTFQIPDYEKFPCLALAVKAGRAGGTAPCILNAANEQAVSAFLKGAIPFTSIPVVVERTLETVEQMDTPTLDDYISSNNEARERATWIISKLSA